MGALWAAVAATLLCAQGLAWAQGGPPAAEPPAASTSAAPAAAAPAEAAAPAPSAPQDVAVSTPMAEVPVSTPPSEVAISTPPAEVAVSTAPAEVAVSTPTPPPLPVPEAPSLPQPPAGLAPTASTVRVLAFDPKGRLMTLEDLLRFIAPAGRPAPRPEGGGLLLSDLSDSPVLGRPWWVGGSTAPAWSWIGGGPVKASLPWPIERDGFSTVIVDGSGAGYVNGQTLLLNEEIALSAYRQLQDSLSERTSSWSPTYKPGKSASALLGRCREAVARAREAPSPREKARLFDEALALVSAAWQKVLFEHGLQTAADPKAGAVLRWGLSLDESLVERPSEHAGIAQDLSEAGATWVRLVFRTNPDDFTYAQARSFTLYENAVGELQKRGIRVMGSVLDSLLWPRNVTPALYQERTRNLVLRFKDRIRSWEVASEPNGNWLGGGMPLPPAEILEIVRVGASEAKRIDPSLETVATLHWWEGTAPDPRLATLPWLKDAMAKGFGDYVDLVGLSVYPDRHPLGLAFDPVFRRLKRLLPRQRVMLGGWSFEDDPEQPKGYWWLEPGNAGEARKDLLVLYTGAAAALPSGVGGGFFWPTLSQMMPVDKGNTALLRLYQRTTKRLRRGK